MILIKFIMMITLVIKEVIFNLNNRIKLFFLKHLKIKLILIITIYSISYNLHLLLLFSLIFRKNIFTII